MKYTLVTFFFLFSLAVCSQDIHSIYYLSNNTLLDLSDNRFVLKTGIEDGEIGWFDGSYSCRNDSIICVDDYYNSNIYFKKKDMFILELLNNSDFQDRCNIANVRILGWESYFWGDYVKEQTCYLMVREDKRGSYVFIWDNNEIDRIYDKKARRYILNKDSLLNLLGK